MLLLLLPCSSYSQRLSPAKDTSSHGPSVYHTVQYAHAYEYSFMCTSTHLAGTMCTCVRVRIYAYEYASQRMHLAGTICTCVQVRIHAYEYASRVRIHAYEYASSNPACTSRRSSEFCYFKALSWHSTCMPSSVRLPGHPQIPVLPNSCACGCCFHRCRYRHRVFAANFS